MPPKRKKLSVGPGEHVPALETGSGAPPANGVDNVRSKVSKPAAASSLGPAPPPGNGSEKKKEKKRKRKDASSQPDGGAPQLAAPLDYKEIGREGWRLMLGHEQVVKVSIVRSLSDALDQQILRGNHNHGEFSLRDKDAVWLNLLTAQFKIRGLAHTLYYHLATKPQFEGLKPKRRLRGTEWATRLIETMESASRSVLGADGDAMVRDMKHAVERVREVNEEYDKLGDEHVGTLIDVYAHCMGIVTNLWLELSDLVQKKFLHGRDCPPQMESWETPFLKHLKEIQSDLDSDGEGEEEEEEDEEEKEEVKVEKKKVKTEEVKVEKKKKEKKKKVKMDDSLSNGK